MALSIGLEPTTDRLTADCSTIELTERIALKRAKNIVGNQRTLCNQFFRKNKIGLLAVK